MATNITATVTTTTAIGNPSQSDNRTDMDHLKNNIDDVYILTNGILVCCK
jgi:hypothetical protein